MHSRARCHASSSNDDVTAKLSRILRRSGNCIRNSSSRISDRARTLRERMDSRWEFEWIEADVVKYLRLGGGTERMANEGGRAQVVVKRDMASNLVTELLEVKDSVCRYDQSLSQPEFRSMGSEVASAEGNKAESLRASGASKPRASCQGTQWPPARFYSGPYAALRVNNLSTTVSIQSNSNSDFSASPLLDVAKSRYHVCTLPTIAGAHSMRDPRVSAPPGASIAFSVVTRTTRPVFKSRPFDTAWRRRAVPSSISIRPYASPRRVRHNPRAPTAQSAAPEFIFTFFMVPWRAALSSIYIPRTQDVSVALPTRHASAVPQLASKL
ncbi:hypothetical protein DFH09DRAFT_1284156 [Mycena vulgaris]|nr:hypothetical protein DFH09DRAFT_1284156 [Mycena vulgaris]